MTRILITGITGFTGLHLANYLLTRGDQVFGFSRQPAPLSKQITLLYGDICDPAAIENVLAQVQPEIIYHLAGLLKSAQVEDLYRINVMGTLALFEAIVKLGLSPKILIAGSSAVYGRGLASRSITEQFKLRPVTHYGASKVAQEALAYRYHLAHNLRIIGTRAFNLLGPGQPRSLACAAFAHQIALAEQTGQKSKIVTGDLSAQRDFTDVRDAVAAYELVGKQGKPGLIYNICSQQAVAIRACLNILIEMATVPLEIEMDKTQAQPHDVPIQVGSAARLFRHTGWRPKIPLAQSLADLLSYWREQLRRD